MKSSIILALGLALAGNAMATDPAPQAQASAPSLKVGIDKTTGKLRPLTAEESAALDAKAAATPARSQQALRAAGTKGQRSASAIPQTIEEALANKRVVHGIVGFKAPMDAMSSLNVTRNADGSLTYAEGETVTVDAQHEEADK